MSEGAPRSRNSREDKSAFIGQYGREMLSVIDDPAERELITRIEAGETPSESEHEQLTNILERFETKIFRFTKSESAPNAKHVLITSDNPGSFVAAKQVIAALEKDPRCKAVTALVSGVAGKAFTEAFPDFAQAREQESVLADALVTSSEEPVDVVLATVSVQNGPEDVGLYAGKSSFGARKTYLLFEGYGSPGGAFKLGTNEQMEEIDGIFCNDDLAKSIVHHQLPDYPVDRILTTGTPIMENLELEKAEEYRSQVRAELGVKSDALTIAYLGDNSQDYTVMPGANPDINAATFEKTLRAVKAFSDSEPGREVALLVRPHPRDPQKERLQVENDPHIDNLHMVNASAPIPFNGMLYASDVVVSIMSTENFLAPARGRRSIFLAYDEPGMGGDALKFTYSEELLAALANRDDVFIASSEQELIETLRKLETEPLPQASVPGSPTKNILNALL